MLFIPRSSFAGGPSNKVRRERDGLDLRASHTPSGALTLITDPLSRARLLRGAGCDVGKDYCIGGISCQAKNSIDGIFS
jgi:hypothetical protein